MFVENLKSLLQGKLENGEAEEALKISRRLVAAQPLEMQWKFLTTRLLAETGKLEGAHEVFEEMLDGILYGIGY
ncbi:hypothetical protein Dimus_031851, partial [Dionaea muscipula]